MLVLVLLMLLLLLLVLLLLLLLLLPLLILLRMPPLLVLLLFVRTLPRKNSRSTSDRTTIIRLPKNSEKKRSLQMAPLPLDRRTTVSSAAETGNISRKTKLQRFSARSRVRSTRIRAGES